LIFTFVRFSFEICCEVREFAKGIAVSDFASLFVFKDLPVGPCIAHVTTGDERSQNLKEERTMDRMLVVVFDTEAKANEGKNVLEMMENEGTITIYSYAVIAKNADGTTSVRYSDDPGPVGTLVGTSLGGLIGVLGGPAGVAIGAATGMVAGSFADLDNARVGDDFIDDVTKKLTPNKFAVAAEIEEEWTTPLDTRMEAIGGIVFRRALSEVNDVVNDEDVAAMKADVAQLKTEQAQSHADRKAKLQDKINQLDTKIQAHLDKAKERRLAAQQRAKAKIELLKTKAAAMKAKAAQTNI